MGSRDILKQLHHTKDAIESQRRKADYDLEARTDDLKKECRNFANHRYDFLSSGDTSQPSASDECRIAQSAVRELLSDNTATQGDSLPRPFRGCYETENEKFENYQVVDPTRKLCETVDDTLTCSAYLREARLRLQGDELFSEACLSTQLPKSV